jgi:hypothetical protein
MMLYWSVRMALPPLSPVATEYDSHLHPHGVYPERSRRVRNDKEKLWVLLTAASLALRPF